jgi:hypothetical protein
MATLALTGNAGTLLRFAKELTGALAGNSDTKAVTVTLDDADFSITYTDGAAGSKKKVTK